MQRLARIAATLLVAAAGCNAAAPAPPADEVEDGVAVAEGKEDNFLSVTAREFVLEGRATVTVAEGTSEADVKKLVSLKHIAIAWFLNQYLVDKEHEDANYNYGGFGAMVKTGSYQDLEIAKVDARTWSFKFAQVIAGR